MLPPSVPAIVSAGAAMVAAGIAAVSDSAAGCLHAAAPRLAARIDTTSSCFLIRPLRWVCEAKVTSPKGQECGRRHELPAALVARNHEVGPGARDGGRAVAGGELPLAHRRGGAAGVEAVADDGG